MQSLHPAQQFVIWALPVLFAITLHEVAHGWVANQLGDPTARMLGRLSLNPFRHIDPIGTVLVPLLTFLSAGMMFGWAKPVPVTERNLRQHRYGMSAVAIAGPASNLLQMLVWALLLRTLVGIGSGAGWVAEPLSLMANEGIKVNIAFALLNLMPILPLDGGRIVDNLLPGPLSARYSMLEPWGLWIVLALALTGLLNTILAPPFVALYGFARALVLGGTGS